MFFDINQEFTDWFRLTEKNSTLFIENLSLKPNFYCVYASFHFILWTATCIHLFSSHTSIQWKTKVHIILTPYNFLSVCHATVILVPVITTQHLKLYYFFLLGILNIHSTEVISHLSILKCLLTSHQILCDIIAVFFRG